MRSLGSLEKPLLRGLLYGIALTALTHIVRWPNGSMSYLILTLALGFLLK